MFVIPGNPKIFMAGDDFFGTFDPQTFSAAALLPIRDVYIVGCLPLPNSVVVAFTSHMALLLIDLEHLKIVKFSAEIFQDVSSWQRLANGNIVFIDHRKSIHVANFLEFFWSLACQWLFLGRTDKNSCWYNFPLEILFNFVKITKQLNFIMKGGY
jgi:hypothetical protein